MREVAGRAVDEFLRHDTFVDDVLVRVDVREELVQRIDTLREAALECLELVRLDDARNRVERKQPLIVRTILVDAELHAISGHLLIDHIDMILQLS